MKVILENTETGELREMGDRGSFKRPWKIKETIPDPPSTSNALLKTKLAVFATKLGLPLPEFLDVARWLLKKDCPFCQMGTEILKRIDGLGETKAMELLNRILIAKNTNDMNTLDLIKQELHG